MSERYSGGLITKTPVTPSGPYETSTASGIWTLEQQAYWQKLGQWPIAGNPAPDAQFNYVTMLLHGDGTNGAGNISFKDSSTTNFAMSSSGNVTQGSFGPYGSNWSNYFDGTGDYLTAANNAALDVETGAFTIEGWIYRDGTGDADWRLVAGSVSSAGFFGGRGTLSLGFGRSAVAWDLESASNVYSLNTWTHVVYVRNGSGNLAIFANGTRVATTTNSNNYGLNGGLIEVGAEGANQYFGGYISNVRVVKGSAVYDPTASTLTVPTTPLTAVSGTGLLTCQSNRFIDNSGNAFALTVNGNTSVQRFNPFGTATAYSTSVIGGSGFFPAGTSDYVYTNTNLAAIGTGNFTIEGWWYPLVAAKQEFCLFSVGNVEASTGLAVATDNSSGIFIYSGNYYGYSTTAGVMTLNAWNHIAITRSGSTITLYLNGVRTQPQRDWGSHNISAAPVYIGSAANGYFSETNGYISDVRYTNTIVYSGTTYTVPTAPLTAISGTGFLANFVNAGIFDNAMMNDLRIGGDVAVSTSVKKFGTGSMFFDGFGSYLTTIDTPNLTLTTSNWTIECWVYLTSITGERTIVAKGRDLAGGLWWWLDGTSLNVRLRNSSSGFVDITATSALTSTSTWYYVAVVRSSNTVTMYVNGASVASGTYSSSLISTYDFEIGAYNAGTSSFKGYIDDLRVTKYARTINSSPTSAFQNTGPT